MFFTFNYRAAMLMSSFLCCMFAVLYPSAVVARPVDVNDGRDATDGWLPRNVLPYAYNLEIRPYLNLSAPPFPFDGDVEIFFKCVQPVNWVTLNYNSLTFGTISILVDPDTPVPAPSPIFQSYSLDSAADFLTVQFINNMIVNATYVLKINFQGILRPPTQRGIYYDYYTDANGNTQYLVATQLESIFARAMFPCFDEPDLKATFSVTVVREARHISLSNMNLLRTDNRGNGFLADVYAMSPVMSTYQVCVVVGIFGSVEAEWQGVTSYPIRLWARPEMVPYLSFAAKIAPQIHVWLEQNSQIPYELPKMDHIALPSKSGAMENWGLITYSEYYLCVNPETSSASGYFIVAAVVAHELAHQWYGNIVTCKTWNDIWLNEGFASYFEYMALDAIGWDASRLHQFDSTQPFFTTDAFNTSDPIVKNTKTVWEAPSVFSGSTYPKGGAIRRMLRAILPPATLSAGITRYLTQFSHDSATTDDLWAVLTAQAAEDGVLLPDGSAVNLKTLMDPWMKQMGYPVVTVTTAGDGTAEVTSERFFNPVGQTADTPSPFNYEWNVPINLVTSATTGDWNTVMPSFWLRLGEHSTNITGLPTSDWALVNPNQLSFFRVNYDSNLRLAINNQLLSDHTVFPSETKSQLIDDTFKLARTGYVSEVDGMDLTRYLSQEHTYNPWFSALNTIRYNDRILRFFMWHSNFRAYVVSLVEPVLNSLGWDYDLSESPSTHYLRRDMISTACLYGHPDCVGNVTQLYNQYIVNPDVNSVDANTLPTVLCAGVARGSSNDWSIMLQQYQQRKNSPFRAERYAYLYALACTQDTTYLDIYLSYIIQGNIIATQDQTQALRYMIMNNIGINMVWSYFQNSWRTVPSSISKLSLLQSIVSTFYRDSDSNDFNNFVGLYPPTGPNEANQFQHMDKIILQNIEWITANQDTLRQWLIDNASPMSEVSLLTTPLPSSPLDFWYTSFGEEDEMQ